MKTEELHAIAQYLYGLLDDIDTASDAAKGDDAYYRRMVEKIQAKKAAVVAECDGYTVTLKPRPPGADALPFQDAADVYLVLDETGAPNHCASTAMECHDHINDAINEHDIDGAGKWTVRRAQLLPMDLTPNVELRGAEPIGEASLSNEGFGVSAGPGERRLSMRECVTHHDACDCREELFVKIRTKGERLEAENSELRAARDWQPIESAPHDKRVLVWSGQEMYCAQWAQNPYTDDEAWIVAEWGTEGDQALVRPTHWMPLPATPTECTRDGGQCGAGGYCDDCHQTKTPNLK